MSFISSSSLHPQSLLLPTKISIPAPPSFFSSYHSSFQRAKPLRPPSLAFLGCFSTYRCFLARTIDHSAENPSEPGRWPNLDCIIASTHKLFDSLPQPVKMFPWAKMAASFFHLVFDLAYSVGKYLSVPLLGVSSLSEIYYCIQERKPLLVLFPFLVGFVLTGVLTDTAMMVSDGLKEGESPWHLYMIATFFLLLKLPGPYYPYLGRLIIPHFANGGLWRTVWLFFVWYRRVGRTREQT